MDEGGAPEVHNFPDWLLADNGNWKKGVILSVTIDIWHFEYDHWQIAQIPVNNTHYHPVLT